MGNQQYRTANPAKGAYRRGSRGGKLLAASICQLHLPQIYLVYRDTFLFNLGLQMATDVMDNILAAYLPSVLSLSIRCLMEIGIAYVKFGKDLIPVYEGWIDSAAILTTL